MAYETIEIMKDGSGLVRLFLNRPEVLNAFDDQMIAELQTALDEIAVDKGNRYLILAGRGDKFCAGADLQWMKRAADFSVEENQADAMRLSDMLLRLNSMPIPVIARVNGAAMGGGAGLVACADIAIALADTQFSFSEVRLGLTPATISPFVIAAIGPRMARRYMLTGERFYDDEAYRIGLLHGVASTEEALDGMIDAIIFGLHAGGPEAIAATKSLINEVALSPISEDLRQMTAGRIAERRASDEGKAGMSAFLNRTNPPWRTK